MRRSLIILFSLTLVFCSISFVGANVGAVSVSAKSYILINADTGEVLSASNAHTRLPMASTTKIMTALLLAELGTPEKTVTVTDEMVRVEGSSMGLKAGDTVTHYGLLVGMLLPSGNDAANSAAVSVAGSLKAFTELMNLRAQEIGMKNTHFVTPSGLDAEGHYSTAYDMALLAREALQNDTVCEIVSQEKITVSFGTPQYQRTFYNHNKLLSSFEYCIGVKTGFTKKSGRCLVSAAEKDGCCVIAVTLNAPDDWNDHKELLELGLSQLEATDVTAKLPIENISVVGGIEKCVDVAVPQFVCGLSRSSLDRVAYKVYTKPFVYAPVSLGQQVGTVEYFYNNELIHTSHIISLGSIGIKQYRPSFSERFADAFKTLFKWFV